MPIYHFHVHDGEADPDRLGSEYANLAAAKIEAVERIGKLLAEEAARFWAGDEWTMDVTDATGLSLFSLVFLATDSPALRS